MCASLSDMRRRRFRETLRALVGGIGARKVAAYGAKGRARAPGAQRGRRLAGGLTGEDDVRLSLWAVVGEASGPRCPRSRVCQRSEQRWLRFVGI